MLKLLIRPDSDPESPREWCNLGRMACWHGRYTLGDEQPTESPDEWFASLADEHATRGYAERDARLYDRYAWQGATDRNPAKYDRLSATLRQRVQDAAGGRYAILPLFLHDHSDLAMNCGGFSCPWDSGQVGYIVCSLADARSNWGLPGSAGWDWTMADWRNEGETITLREATERALRGEVETYSQWLAGDVWGFELVDSSNDECLDSCWGFYGDDPRQNGMADHIAPEWSDCFDNVEVRYDG